MDIPNGSGSFVVDSRRPYVDTFRPWHKKRLQINFRAMLWWERKFHSWNFRFVVLFLSRSKERKFQGLGSESSKERKFQGAKVSRNESSRERKFHGAKVPRSESSRERKFHIWNFRSRERMVLGAKSPVTGTGEGAVPPPQKIFDYLILKWRILMHISGILTYLF